MEHRWGQRRETSRSVFLRTSSGLAAHGQLKNVSVSGAFIVTPLPVSPFTRLQLFFASEGRRALQPLEGEVVRRTAEGIAIEWKEFGNAVFLAMGESPAETAGEIRGETRRDAETSASTARKMR